MVFKKSKIGSVFLELVIYCALLATTITLFLHTSVTTLIKNYDAVHNAREIIEIYALSSMLQRTMSYAPINKQAWILSDETHLIWHQENEDHGWDFAPELVYHEGIYNAEKKQWTKKKLSTIFENSFGNVIAKRDQDQNMLNITLSITKKINKKNLEMIIFFIMKQKRIYEV